MTPQPTPPAKRLSLEEVEWSSVDDDIKLILRTLLRDRAEAGERYDCQQGRPNSKVIDIGPLLCRGAEGSFAYASDLVKLLTSQRDLTVETVVRRVRSEFF